MKISLLFAASLLLGAAVRAQVAPSLVAESRSVQPGHSVTVALRLEHQPEWHSYWIAAGTGYPTSIQWDLPRGWTAGPIQWPTPVKILGADGEVTGNGYTGTVYLPVTLTAPADARPGNPVIKAEAKWLMCAKECIPGSAHLTLPLTVSPEPPTLDPAVSAELARMPMPQARGPWRVSAYRTAGQITLQIAGAGALQSPHFFSADSFIQYDQSQTAVSADGRLTLSLPIADDAPTSTNELVGILAYTDDKGAYRGLAVDAPISDAPVPSAAAAGPGSSAQHAAPSGTGAGEAGGGRAGLLATLFLAFVGGLILNLMPCVFPVLGIKIVGFVNHAGSDRYKVSIHALAFTAGVVLSFWALAALLAALRGGGRQLGWGFQLQSPVFVFGLAIVMLIFALSLSGVFEFGVRLTGAGSGLNTRDGYSGSFFTGILATVVATPCSAPFLAPALGAALALPIAQSFAVFTAIALGLSAPYLLLSIFPGAVRVLPRPGRWMETFKQLMAFPLYASVGYLIWVLAGQTSENGLLMVLFGLTVVALAVWLYGRYTAPGATTLALRAGTAGGLALLAAGIYLGLPRVASSTDLQWEPWSVDRVKQLQTEGRFIYVDFTARWCATCQANKKLVFGSDAIKRDVRDRHVALLEADWTNSDPRITAELAKWHRAAVPLDLVYKPRQAEPAVLPEILTPSIVSASLDGTPNQLR